VITADHTSQVEHDIYRSAAGTFAVPVIFYQPGSNLKGCRPGISQQIDIMPTVLNYLGYDKPYVAFGCDLLNTPADETYAVNYYNGIYQYFQGNIMLQFDGEKSVALYDYVADPLLERNMLSEQPQIVKKMETKLKAIVQQYMLRMTQDRLTAE
jgi:phosphoglycerol transferase MdoB-like AlkP superfamily enzyme